MPEGASVIFGVFSQLSDGLDIHSWSGYEENGAGFYICKNLKMTIYSHINPHKPPNIDRSRLTMTLYNMPNEIGNFKSLLAK